MYTDFEHEKKIKYKCLNEMKCWRYTNTDLKISLNVSVDIKTISSKFRVLNPNNSRVIYP